MRAEIIETLKSVALKYVHFEPEPPLVHLMEDILQSRNWKQLFGSLQQPKSHANEFLQALAKEYKSCKDKEARKQAKENSKGQKQKLLISNTKAKSKIAMFRDTPLDVSSRVEAAEKIGRICQYGDEKRRLLSIVVLITLTVFCKICSSARPTPSLQQESILSCLDMVVYHLVTLNSVGSGLANNRELRPSTVTKVRDSWSHC